METLLNGKAELAGLRDELLNKTIVFTNGCFDILHTGHLWLLEQAATLGDILVVGINSDSSVRRIKGASRPIISEIDRAMLIAALRVVDYVTVFSEETPIQVIEALRPDVHVKGGDYKADSLAERGAVLQAGGRIHIVNRLEGLSTSDIVRRIRSDTNC